MIEGIKKTEYTLSRSDTMSTLLTAALYDKPPQTISEDLAREKAREVAAVVASLPEEVGGVTFDSGDVAVSELDEIDEWKVIPGFSKYEVSRWGEVRNKATLQVLKPGAVEGGYQRVSVSDDENKRKTCYIHQLVAIAYLPNPENKPSINHKNHVRNDNCLENLEWYTVAEQNRHKRKQAVKEHYKSSSRAVWKCHPVTGVRIELYDSIKLASIAVKGDASGKTKITGVAQKRVDIDPRRKTSSVRKTAYGFKWEYDTQLIDSEVWKEIDPSFIKGAKNYSVSDQGRIRNHKGRIGDAYVGTGGYSWFCVSPHQYLAHILIAKVFLPNPDNKPVINHIDGVKTNNVLSNLEWNTYSENAQHAHDRRLNTSGKIISQISIIESHIIQTFENIKIASERTGICADLISKAAKHEFKHAGGFLWRFTDSMEQGLE